MSNGIIAFLVFLIFGGMAMDNAGSPLGDYITGLAGIILLVSTRNNNAKTTSQ